MLDDSYIYKKDRDKYKKDFEGQDFSKFYDTVYQNGRLDTEKDKSYDTADLIANYNKNIKLVSDLVKDNYQLQHTVHKLGLKNRIRQKIGRYTPPDAVRTYVTESELQEILNHSYETSRRLPEINANQNIVDDFRNSYGEPFEKGIETLQKSLDLHKFKKEPLVSIIIPTRNGLDHIQRLFKNFAQNTGYSNYEIIIVDNASTDSTVEFLKSLSSELNIRIISNKENKSFSESNNIASRKAKGEYFLFLNNDVSPIYGWLNHLVYTASKSKNIGAVGAKLIYPYRSDYADSLRIQHGGIGFQLEEDFIRPINQKNGENVLSTNIIAEEKKPAVTAACLIVHKDIYQKVNGFTEDYWYGYEDVDICLKIEELGYENVINNKALLYHYEFGTQGKIKSDQISGYRKKNMDIFRSNWQQKLYKRYWSSILNKDNYITDKTLHFCFITTESSDSTAAGDFFTAKELALSLEKIGYKTSFVGVRNTPKPYDIPDDVDVIISMIDGYDISKIKPHKAKKIAWCRNWFERWAEQPYFRDFDIVLCNSKKAQQMFSDKYYIESSIFNIATNADRFTNDDYSTEELGSYKSDICFTGNYWHDPRDITTLFKPSKFSKYEIKIYGRDWNHVKDFAPYHQGFIKYEHIPKVYKSGKILIDDATWIVNEWGSVNSRVFDGAASGVLVMTNGIEGNANTLDGLLPTFSSEKELSSLLRKYLESPSERNRKIKEVREYILKNHTYDNRAKQLIDILTKNTQKKTIDIKMPIPKWSEANKWGDLHFAVGIKRQFTKKGFNVNLHTLPEWHKGYYSDASIVLRGLSEYNTRNHQMNIMWNISHPEKVTTEEYSMYNYVFVASKLHVNYLKKQGLENIHVLYQCYDDENFGKKSEQKLSKSHPDIDVLFVGNTRNLFRKSVKDLMSWKNKDRYTIKIYGQNWEKFINKKYIGGVHINNKDLSKYYGDTKILINDHWDDMNKYGFASNRLFDASACGTFIISDKNPGINDVFGPNTIEQYSNEDELHKLLDRFLTDDTARKKMADKASNIVRNKHTFKKRVNEILETIPELNND